MKKFYNLYLINKFNFYILYLIIFKKIKRSIILFTKKIYQILYIQYIKNLKIILKSKTSKLLITSFAK